MAKHGKRDWLKPNCLKGLAGSNPAPGTYDLGSMKRSMSSTDERFEMDMVHS